MKKELIAFINATRNKELNNLEEPFFNGWICQWICGNTARAPLL